MPKVLTEHQKLSPSTSGRWHEVFPRKKITLLKIFLPLNYFWQKSAKVLISTRKNCKNFFFKNQIFHKHFLYSQIAVLKKFWSFCAKLPQNFPHSLKTVKELINFRRKNSPIKNLHWEHRMQFWKTCRRISAESPKSLCPKSKNKGTIQRICFQKPTLPKISTGHLKAVLTTQPD